MFGVSLKEFTEKRRRFIGDTNDLVRRLSIEFEIELGLGLAVIPVLERFELAPPQWPPGEWSMSRSPMIGREPPVNSNSSEATAYWPRYVAEWLRWNHFRTIAAVGAAIALTVALTRLRPPAT